MPGDTREPSGSDPGHEKRVQEAFDDLHAGLGERADEAREELEPLRDAAARRNGAEVKERLEAVKETHGWLYEELVKHPKVAALIDELALWGF